MALDGSCVNTSRPEKSDFFDVAPERITGRRVLHSPSPKIQLLMSELSWHGRAFLSQRVCKIYTLMLVCRPPFFLSAVILSSTNAFGGGAAVRADDPPNHPMC